MLYMYMYHAHTYMYTHTYMYICNYTSTDMLHDARGSLAYLCVYIYIYMCVCLYGCRYVCMRVCMQVCMCVYMFCVMCFFITYIVHKCMHPYIHKCTNIHLPTYQSPTYLHTSAYYPATCLPTRPSALYLPTYLSYQPAFVQTYYKLHKTTYHGLA